MTERTRTAARAEQARQRATEFLDIAEDPDTIASAMSVMSNLAADVLWLLAERDAAVAALREAKAELTNETVSYQDGKPLPLDPLTDIDNAIAVIDAALAAVGEAEEQK